MEPEGNLCLASGYRLTTSDQRSPSGSLLKPIEREVQDHAQKAIHHSGQDSTAPTPVQRQIDHAAGNREINRLMDQVKSQGDQKARPGIFDVQLRSQRPGPVAYNSLGDPVDSDGISA